MTVLDVANNRVTQIKTAETDGYRRGPGHLRQAPRVARRRSRRPGTSPRPGSRQASCCANFPWRRAEIGELKVGATVVAVDTFKVGELVDVTGTTKGKGFSGVIKRHHFSSNRASHGNSRSHNVPGSIGMAQDPGRVFPGKRMAGQLGNVTRTTQTLTVVRVDAERGLLLVKGCVPGADGGHIVVRPAVKTPAKKGA